MDSIPDQVRIVFDDLRSDGPVEARWQLLLRVEATFSFIVRGVTVLHDPHFNVVEFAVAVNRWLQNPVTDFSFRTMDAEETDILFFRRDDHQWRIGSIWGAADGVLVDANDLSDAVGRFIEALGDACDRHLLLDIRPLLVN